MEIRDEASERIKRLRKKYHDDVPRLSIERARYYTEKWQETEGTGTPLPVRVALAMKNVYENMTHYVDPDDRIAGYWTEYFLGMPIDIERGVFNLVLQAELDKSSIVYSRVRSFLKFLIYMIRKRTLLEFRRNLELIRTSGPMPMNTSFKTMAERQINPYTIDPEDKKYLKKKLLQYWRGKTTVDYVQKEMERGRLFSRDMQDFAMAVPANTSRQVILITTCANISSYQGHVILDYEKVLTQGLLKMKDEVHDKIAENGNLNKQERAFLESIEISLEGVMAFARRLAEKVEEKMDAEADPGRKAVLEQMLKNCQKVPFHPAETFYQAVQSAWTIKTAVELAHPVNLHCFGRMDQILYPYYQKDIEQGRITREVARELLEELLLKIMSQNIRPESNILSNFYQRYLGSSPVTIGGIRPDGKDGTNELTFLFLEAVARSKPVTNIALRVHKDMPDEVLLAAAKVLYSGGSNLALFYDEANIEAMKRRGFENEDSRNYAVMGCVEMLCPGKTGGMSANALLLSRLLDITLHNGDSRTLMGTVREVGLKTGDPDSFTSFDQLLDAFIAQGRLMINKIVDASNLRDRIYAERLPAPYISAFINGCLEKKRDVTQGGGKYDLSGISFINSIANMVDSLYVIKKLIFEEKRFTFKQFLEAIDQNFVGHENLLRLIQRVEGKWGNGNPEVDELARTVTTRLFEETYKYRNFKNGPFVVYVISMTTHTIDGRISIATPDGRRAAKPYAASCNPYNVERCGVTGVMKSVAALPFEHVLGCAVNIKFHPTAIGENDEIRRKWVALLRTYFQLGGVQVQPTVASAEMLREAQKDPDSYQDLIVKVGGYSTYFVDLGREIQDEVIARTEHGAAC